MQQIVFTDVAKAEILEMPVPEMGDGDVKVRTLFSAISTGTERANLKGNLVIPGMRGRTDAKAFPRYLGYSDTGIVEEIGKNVTSVKVGDRVACIWGAHRTYQVLPERQVVPIPQNVDMKEAAYTFISTFPMAAIRKVGLEIGESAMVVGLGLLGQIAIRLLRAAGAVPIIAVDPNPNRRALALNSGADIGIDPTRPDYEQQVREATGGKGVSCMIEVTGNGEALNQALRCMAKMGRVALLGCTRKPTEVDFYYDVHIPGVEIYGAHTAARPETESYPGHWTHYDDCAALLKLLSVGRVELRTLISETHPVSDAPDVYKRLAADPDFPVGVVFEW